MRFLLDDEQLEFARTLDSLLGSAGTPGVVRSWAAGDHGPGRAVWAQDRVDGPGHPLPAVLGA
ncbi:acyl-CoA dehydrogenase, partial [Streptomyces sp. NPDC002130]